MYVCLCVFLFVCMFVCMYACLFIYLLAVTSGPTVGPQILGDRPSRGFRTTGMCQILGVIRSLNLCLMTKLTLILTLNDAYAILCGLIHPGILARLDHVALLSCQQCCSRDCLNLVNQLIDTFMQ